MVFYCVNPNQKKKILYIQNQLLEKRKQTPSRSGHSRATRTTHIDESDGTTTYDTHNIVCHDQSDSPTPQNHNKDHASATKTSSSAGCKRRNHRSKVHFCKLIDTNCIKPQRKQSSSTSSSTSSTSDCSNGHSKSVGEPFVINLVCNNNKNAVHLFINSSLIQIYSHLACVHHLDIIGVDFYFSFFSCMKSLLYSMSARTIHQKILIHFILIISRRIWNLWISLLILNTNPTSNGTIIVCWTRSKQTRSMLIIFSAYSRCATPLCRSKRTDGKRIQIDLYRHSRKFLLPADWSIRRRAPMNRHWWRRPVISVLYSSIAHRIR